jgi:hypothetical protein
LPAVAFYGDADELGLSAAAEDQGSGADRGDSEGALQDRLGEEAEG